MRHVRVWFLGIGIPFSVALVLAGSSVAQADLNHRLSGDYAFSVSLGLAVDVVGFNPLTLARLGGGGSNTSAMQGVAHFNGDGTGTLVRQLFVVLNDVNGVGSIPVSQEDDTCTFTYSVNPDNSFSLQATCSGTVIAGFRAGQTVTITGILLQGRIGHDGQVLILGNTMPQEIIKTFNGADAIHALVHRSGMAIKISP